ncbi:MAG TPA: HK97 gp10 family phage protein [Terracidiphilus sp.]|nr:HK97 gp10 family phage protein [Terracidiphilus sp.]
MPGATFSISIPNLPALQAALANYPSISQPIIQRAVVAAQAILAKFTTAATVPVKTGYLVQNWAFEVGNLQARWYPRASYAPYVEFGTGPHEIKAVNKKVLANVQTGQIFGPVVHHPGTKANPFMERIVAASQPDIETLFLQAMDQVNEAIASQANG